MERNIESLKVNWNISLSGSCKKIMIPRSLWTCVKYAILHHNNTPRKKTWEGSKENMLRKNQRYQLLNLFALLFILWDYIDTQKQKKSR
ncbi:hypothetical protein YC2023_051107 [Brassica napus]